MNVIQQLVHFTVVSHSGIDIVEYGVKVGVNQLRIVFVHDSLCNVKVLRLQKRR